MVVGRLWTLASLLVAHLRNEFAAKLKPECSHLRGLIGGMQLISSHVPVVKLR
jgi:hypothetical protein